MDHSELRTLNVELMAQNAVLRSVIKKAYSELMDALPHLAQIDKANRTFIESHVGLAMEILEDEK